MTGMRGGFKSLAASVSGNEQAAKKKSSLAGTALTVVLFGLAALFLWKRFG